MYQGILQSSGMVVVILIISSEFLEILNPLVSETEPSGFAEPRSIEQTVALDIEQKLEHLVFLEN
jgi:hypothetical protein